MSARLECRPEGMRATTISLDVSLAEAIEHEIVSEDSTGVFLLIDRAVTDRVPTEGATERLVIEGGESVKQLSVLGTVLDALAEANIDRGGTLIAIGGGATGDLGGLAASLWLRGIRLVMAPTTLLSMVDSSVGGKTAIDTEAGKNLVGSFWPAERVHIDTDVLHTLPDEQYRSGLGEVAKIAIGLDPELFAFAESHAGALSRREPAAVRTAIEHCLRAKIDIVERDPREAGPRRLLNLGHTLAHAIEAHSGHAVLHGLAVAEGLRDAITRAQRLGHLQPGDAQRGIALLDALGFEPIARPPTEALHAFLMQDKKREGIVLREPLPTGIGASEVFALPVDAFLTD